MKSISGKAFCKILERHGWQLKKITGSHHIYMKPGEIFRLSVPVHGNKDLKLGLLTHHMKIARLKEADLV